jgi:pilus assembly protein Flp/PilA
MIEAVEYLRIRLAGMCKTERGASAVEYGLLVSLIAIAIIAAVALLGGKLSGVFSKTTASLNS